MGRVCLLLRHCLDMFCKNDMCNIIPGPFSNGVIVYVYDIAIILNINNGQTSGSQVKDREYSKCL